MSNEKITAKKLVELTYQIADEQGEIIERVDIPLKYIHAVDGMLFPKVEAALTGCVVGDKVDVTLTPAEGFGEQDPNLLFTDDLKNVPEQFHQIGAEVEMQNDRGEVKKFAVSKIENGKLTVDGNHPLAGKTLVFSIKVVTVRDASDDELKNGVTQNFSTGTGSEQLH